MADTRAHHGELQAQVMRIVREHGPCTVRQVHDVLRSDRDVAYTTVLTVLTRLTERGLLDRKQVGKAGVFSLAHSDDPDAAGQAIEQLLGRFGAVAVSQFVSQAKGDPDLIAQLRKLVESADA